MTVPDTGYPKITESGDLHPASATGVLTEEGVQAPIDRAELARSLRPFGRSTTLPAAAYTDPEVFRWEQRAALAGSWVCVGREDELLIGRVTQQAMVIGDVSVVLTRTDGTLRGFANTCPHRGHELLAEGARRILLIAPKPLLGQWKQELFQLFDIVAQEAEPLVHLHRDLHAARRVQPQRRRT